MVGKILNKNYEVVSIVDIFESFIWTDRYNEPGEFELYVEASTSNFQKFILGYYLEIEESDRTMVIETLETSSDADSGTKLIVKGRSLESILDRRIIWEEFTMADTNQDKHLWTCVWKCLTKCLLPTGEPSGGNNRIISNFSYETIEPTGHISEIEFDKEIQASVGDNLLDIVMNLCQEKHVGFKILRDGSNFKMSLFEGVDRSYNQSNNSYVVFSYDFDNVINLEYLNSIEPYKNTALVIGEGNASSSTKVVVGGDNTGLDRREVHITPENFTQGDSSQGTYEEQLTKRGETELAKIDYCETKVFSGEIDAEKLFVYNRDFMIGDIVQVANEFGISNPCRITEFVRSEDSNGYICTPTFTDISTEK